MTISMTAAEAKTIRERIGVNTAFVAGQIGVTKGRVWEYESPERRIVLPAHAATVLTRLGRTFDRAVEKAADQASSRGYIPRHVDLRAFEAWMPSLRGWGAGTQAALIAAVQQQVQTTVEYR